MDTATEPATVIDVAGSRMSYLDVGSGDVVVLGHSYLWDARMWRPQVAALSRTHRVIVPELWGHGRSGALPEGTTDLRDLAAHHLELLDKLGVDRFALVGLSVGGMWAAELALAQPERVTALALMDTYLGAEPIATRSRYFAMLAAVEMAGGVPEPIQQAILPLFLAPATIETRPDLVEMFLGTLRRFEPKRLVDTVVPLGRMIFGRRDALDDLWAIRLPTVVMTGQHDASRPVEEGRRMADAMGCGFVEIPGAGHIPSLEAAEMVTRRLVEFVAGINDQ